MPPPLLVPMVPGRFSRRRPAGKRDALCVVLDLDETLVCAYNADAVPSRLSEPRVAARHRTFGLASSSSSEALVPDGAPRPGIAFGATGTRGRTNEAPGGIAEPSGALGADPENPENPENGLGGSGATPPEGSSAAVAVVVFVRPGLARFLDAVAEFAETVVFTAGAEGYARPLCDVIDPRGRVDARLYRDACVRTPVRDHVKDLAALGRDPRRTVLVDNNPFSFLLQPENGAPCASFVGDPEDRHLERTILPLLRNLAAEVARGGDVRPMLRRRFDMEAWFARRFRAAGIDCIRRDFRGRENNSGGYDDANARAPRRPGPGRRRRGRRRGRERGGTIDDHREHTRKTRGDRVRAVRANRLRRRRGRRGGMEVGAARSDSRSDSRAPRRDASFLRLR